MYFCPSSVNWGKARAGGPDNYKWRQTPSVAVGVSTTTWTQHLLTDLVTHIHEYRPVV